MVNIKERAHPRTNGDLTMNAPQDPPPAPDITANVPAPGDSAPASVIAFLFADRFVPLERQGVMGTEALASGKAVVSSTLVTTVAAIALWNLQEGGAVELEVAHERKLGLMPWTTARIRLRDQSFPGQGLEGMLLAALEREKKGRNPGVRVETVIKKALGSSVNPTNQWINYLVRIATESHYITLRTVEGEPSRVLHKTTTRTVAEPNTPAMHGLEAGASDLAERWKGFVASEPELHNRLLKETASGIRLAKISDTNADD
ncbi:MAG: hypothetical protein ABI276_00490 [Acidimicrobiales bacterium]